MSARIARVGFAFAKGRAMMRTPLYVVAILGVSFLAACGDASGNSSQNFRNAQTNGSDLPGTPDDSSSTDPTAGRNNEPPANMGANPATPPAAPMTPSTPAMNGTFTAAVDNTTPAVDMGKQIVLTVTITPAMGFTGTVNLDVTGLPATGVTAKFDNAAPSITGTTPATAKLTLDVAYAAQANTIPIKIEAKSGTQTSTAMANFKINGQFTMEIPLNIAALKTAGYDPTFGTPVPLTAPADGTDIVVKVINLDSTSHIVHGNGAGQTVNGVASTASLPHGSTATALTQNTVDPTNRVAKAGQTYNGYMHDLGSGSGTGFVIQVK
jgi:hypothetical protein